MRCLKIPRRYLIYCFGLLFSFFFTLFFCSSSSFAVSDLVITTSTSNPCNGNCYGLGYRYIIYDNPNYMTASYQYCVRLGFTYINNTWSQQVQSFSRLKIQEISRRVKPSKVIRLAGQS